MKITRILAYRVELPSTKGATSGPAASRSRCSTARSSPSRPIEGITGYGEVCPLGPFYLPAYAQGARTGIAELGPHLLGEDPTPDRQAEPAHGRRASGPPVRQVGDRHRLLGHPGQGHRASRSACSWAGRYGDDFVLYRAISQESPEAMARRVAGYRAEGYRRFQFKVGGDPHGRHRTHPGGRGRARSPATGLIADANTGWLMHDALRVVRAVRDVDVYIEQPCRTYDECLTIRRHCDHPFVLDEVIDSIDPLLRGHADRAMDVVNIKISKFGGLTRAAQARDLCVSLGHRDDDRG